MQEYEEGNKLYKVVVENSALPLALYKKPLAEVLVVTKGHQIFLPAKFECNIHDYAVFTLQGIEIMKGKVDLQEGQNHLRIITPQNAQVLLLRFYTRDRQQQFKILDL